jgi:two-component system cell cycle response regulator
VELTLQRNDDTARVAITEILSEVSEVRGPLCEGVLVVLRGPNPGFVFTLDGPEALIGRSPEAQVCLRDGTLSRHHARIRSVDGRFVIEDLGSTNGTYVDGQRVQAPVPLQDGARITLGGRTVLRFALHDAVEQEAARSTHELTVRDPLTHAYNRRHLEERLISEVAFSHRHNTPLSLLLVDIDGFKQINDTYGHIAGDDALRALTTALQAMVRKEDLVGRFGGEEFAIVARGIDRRGAITFAERIRDHVERMRIATHGEVLRITVSIGVAFAEGTDVTAERLFDDADSALYAAKRGGRNRVESARVAATGSRPSVLPSRR